MLKDNSGETLVETLTATVIIIIIVLVLVTSVKTASQISAEIKDTDISFKYTSVSPANAKVSVIGDSFNSYVNVKLYESNGYKYYE